MLAADGSDAAARQITFRAARRVGRFLVLLGLVLMLLATFLVAGAG